jgi:hypothetical protein
MKATSLAIVAFYLGSGAFISAAPKEYFPPADAVLEELATLPRVATETFEMSAEDKSFSTVLKEPADVFDKPNGTKVGILPVKTVIAIGKSVHTVVPTKVHVTHPNQDHGQRFDAGEYFYVLTPILGDWSNYKAWSNGKIFKISPKGIAGLHGGFGYCPWSECWAETTVPYELGIWEEVLNGSSTKGWIEIKHIRDDEPE